MKLCCSKNKKAQTGTTAQLVDGSLVMSMPDALTPAVWRYDLGSSKDVVFQVEEDDKGQHVFMALVGKTTKVVASYETKDMAVNALMAASTALEHGQQHGHACGHTHKQNAAAGHGGAAPEKSGKGHMIASLAGLAILALLIFMLMNAQPTRLDSGVSESAAPAGAVSGGSQAGVPMSADDFLRQR